MMHRREWKVSAQSLEAIRKRIATSVDQNVECVSEINSPPSKRVKINETDTTFPVLTVSPEILTNSLPCAMEEDDIEPIEDLPSTRRGVRRLMRDYEHKAEDIVGRYQIRPETSSKQAEVNQLMELLFPTRRKVGKQENMAQFEITVMERTAVAVEQYEKQKKVFMNGLPNDIIGVSDDTFDLLISRYGVSMGCENLNMLTVCAESKYVDGELVTQDKRKFYSIIRHGLLPQLSSNECVRKLFESYQKLLTIDQEMVIQHLLIPLIVNKGSLVKVLYQKLNTHLLLVKLLGHLVLKSILLTPPIITTVGFLLDKESEYLALPSSDYLFTLLKTATGYSMSEKLAAFYYSVMKKFIDSMTEMEFRQLYSLNNYNITIYKALIIMLADQRMKQIEQNALFTAGSPLPPSPHTISVEAILRKSSLNDQYAFIPAVEEVEMEQVE